MCTAISFLSKDHYFGRNLDLEYHYLEEVTVTPRNYPFSFRCGKIMNNHFAMIGIATVVDDYPLYYDATNEYGLSMAGLNFPGNAVYHNAVSDKVNIAAYELIPWILGQCKTLKEAKKHLAEINIWDEAFSAEFPPTPLHWMICDHSGSLVAESTADGLQIYENPINVLTNNPPFPYHLYHIVEYLNITRETAANRFSDQLDLKPFSNGMGGIGLPGDLSSSSRFIKAAFTLINSVCGNDESESISQFFHVLDSVAQQRGCVRVNGDFEITYYSSCCNTDKGIYYYKTYDNSQITAIDLHKAELNACTLIRYPLITEQQIRMGN